ASVAATDHDQMHGSIPPGFARQWGWAGGRAASEAGPSWAVRAEDAAWSWWGTIMPAAWAGVSRGYSALITTTASAPPVAWAGMKGGPEGGAIPAKVSENIRPTVIAGLAKLVEELKKYAAPM